MSVVQITVAVRNQVAAGLAAVRTQVQAAMASIQQRIGQATQRWKGFGSALDEAVKAAITLAPALLPIAAALVPIAAGAAGAAVALGAFGAAVISQVSSLSDAAKAEEKYDEAVTDTGAASKESAKALGEYQKSLAKMPPATREAALGFAALKKDFTAWSDELASSTMPVFTKAFSALRDIFPKFTPLVAATSVELSGLMDRLKVGVNTAAFDSLVKKFSDFSVNTLRKVIDGVGDLAAGVTQFAAGGGFQAFMDYARENGPLVGDTLKNLALVLLRLLESASGLGPVMLGLVNSLTELLLALPQGLVTTVLNLAAALSLLRFGYGIYAAMGAGIATLSTQLTALGLTAPAVARVATSLRVLQGALGVVGVIFAVKTAVEALSSAFGPAPPKVDKLGESLLRFQQDGKATGEAARLFGEDLKGLGDNIETLAGRSTSFDWLPGMKQAAGLDAAKKELRAYDEALSQMVRGGNIEGASAAFREVSTQAREQGVTLNEVRGLFPAYKEALADNEAQQKATAKAMGLFGDSARGTTEALKEQRQSADSLKTALDNLNGTQLSLNEAQRALQEAIDDGTASLKENGRTLDINTEKGRANASALDAIAKAAMAEADATLIATGSTEQATRVLQTARDELIRQAQQYGLTAEQARQYADKVLSIPKAAETNVIAKTEVANSRLDAFRQNVASLQDKQITVKTIYESRYDPATQSPFGTGRAIGGVIGKFANGGVAGIRGAMALVGEQGPELVRLPYGSSVMPAGQTRQMMGGGGGGGTPAPVVLEFRSGGSRLDDLLIELVREQVRIKGGNVQTVLGKG